MFYEVEINSHIRVDPTTFTMEIKDSILKMLLEKFENYSSKDLGLVIGVKEVTRIGDGIIIPGDGAAYYDVSYKLLTFVPDMQEVVFGKITDITDFGAFLNIGAVDGMVHVSQTMDDFVSFSKSGTLSGKETKKVLKVNDKCIARIIAVSYKDQVNPKVGLTMRQPYLGSIKTIEEETKKAKKAAKEEKKAAKEQK